MNRDEWLKERRKHIGASDAAAILGLDPHRSPLDIWLEKVRPEMVDAPADEDFLEFGTDVEPAIERRYVKETGRAVYHPSPAIIVHPKFPELACTPDGLSDSPDPIVVEYKFERYSDNFGDPGSDQIPDHFLTQVSHQMACTGRDRADLALMHGAPPIRIYRAYRDHELERILIDRLRAWWADYVVKEVEPPIDSSDTWSSYLAKKYPANRGEIVKVEDSATIAAIGYLRGQLESLKSFEADIEKVKNELKALIGENDGLITPDGTKITWRKSKDTVEDVTDWKAVAERFAAYLCDGHGYEPERIKAEIERATTHGVVTRRGARKFIIKESESCKKLKP